MANALYGKGREKFATKLLDWVGDTIKAWCVNIALYGKVITNASNTTPIVITSAGHGFANGDTVLQSKVTGNTAANGTFKAANVAANTYELTDRVTGANIAGNGAYIASGFAVDLDKDEFLSDIPAGARVAVGPALTSKAAPLGVCDADDSTVLAVVGAAVDLVVLAKDTGVAGTSPLIAAIDTMTGLPFVPSGADVILQWDNGANRIFKL